MAKESWMIEAEFEEAITRLNERFPGGCLAFDRCDDCPAQLPCDAWCKLQNREVKSNGLL